MIWVNAQHKLFRYVLLFLLILFFFSNESEQSDTIKAPSPKQNPAKQTTLCLWRVEHKNALK